MFLLLVVIEGKMGASALKMQIARPWGQSLRLYSTHGSNSLHHWGQFP